MSASSDRRGTARTPTARRILRGAGVASVLAVLVYGVLLFASDRQAVADSLARVDLATIVTVLALAVANIVLRAFRLTYLLGVCGAPVSVVDALYLQWSGMTMTITPGKVGEVLKAFLAREIAGLPASRGVGVVLVERLTDLLAVLALAAGGISLIGGSEWALALVVAVVVVGTVVVSRPQLHEWLLGVLSRRSWGERIAGHAEPLLATLHVTLRPSRLAVTVPLTVLAWALEGLGFHLALRALGFEGLDVWAAIALYAVATVVGALAMLPGGIGLTELSMMGILVASGATRDVAFSATAIIRLATLWMPVGVGWAVFASRPRLMRRFLYEDDSAA